MTAPSQDFEIREAADADQRAVIALLRDTLGWRVDDWHDELFRWKHVANPFGPSPAWVAVARDRIVGFRTFMRWEFEDNGRVLRAVRAVDTATAPDYQGHGVFTALTRHALEHIPAGTDFVFNTPNDASRPGYRKLGWREIGRVPVRVRPRSLPGLYRLARARVPAGLESDATGEGVPAADVFDDAEALGSLLTANRRRDGVRTRLSPAFLRWRYGAPFLGYRAVVGAGGVPSGVALVRVRRRGPAREAALSELVAPPANVRDLVRRVARTFDADYVLATGGTVAGARGFVPLPRAGPQLVWRSVAAAEPPKEWNLQLGDVELF